MVRYKILLHCLLPVVAISAALIFVYLYGAFFEHDRYWNGTIRRVEETEIELVRGMALLMKDQKDARDYDRFFASLGGKLAVTVKRDGQNVYTNEIPGKSPFEEVTRMPTGDERVSVEIRRYKPPLWPDRFGEWLSHVGQWFTPKYDYITVPFLSAVGIFYLFQYALVWRYRERHVSKEVHRLLLDIEKDR